MIVDACPVEHRRFEFRARLSKSVEVCVNSQCRLALSWPRNSSAVVHCSVHKDKRGDMRAARIPDVMWVSVPENGVYNLLLTRLNELSYANVHVPHREALNALQRSDDERQVILDVMWVIPPRPAFADLLKARVHDVGDVTLVCSDGERVSADANVLAKSSEYFKTAFASGVFHESTTREVVVAEDSSVMRTIVKHCCAEFEPAIRPSSSRLLRQLWLAADKYMLPELAEDCAADMERMFDEHCVSVTNGNGNSNSNSNILEDAMACADQLSAKSLQSKLADWMLRTSPKTDRAHLFPALYDEFKRARRDTVPATTTAAK